MLPAKESPASGRVQRSLLYCALSLLGNLFILRYITYISYIYIFKIILLYLYISIYYIYVFINIFII